IIITVIISLNIMYLIISAGHMIQWFPEKIIYACLGFIHMQESWIRHLHQHPHGEHIRGEMVDLL
uniref:hypothetical protein n=1 Tax=Butyribacter sp. TaxID=2822465 RepID=UPI0040298AB4